MTYTVKRGSLDRELPEWLIKMLLDSHPEMVIDVRKVHEDVYGLPVYIPVTAPMNLGMDDLTTASKDGTDWHEPVQVMLSMMRGGKGPRKGDVLLLSPTADIVLVVSEDVLRVRVN